MTPEEQTTIDCLKHAIEDAQGTIRAYDAKAEVLGVLITIVVGSTTFSLFPSLYPLAKAVLIASWVVCLVAIALLGLVLYPKANEFAVIRFGTYSPNGTYYLHNIATSPHTVSSLAAKAMQTNWVEELMYESMKLSLIRDRKHKWFVLALQATGIALVFIFAAILLGAICG